MFSDLIVIGSLVVVFSILGIGLRQSKRGYFLHYLVFLRYPLLCTLGLVLLPTLATRFLPLFIKNLFIVSDVYGLALIVAQAILCSWVILYTSSLIFARGDKQFKLKLPEAPTNENNSSGVGDDQGNQKSNTRDVLQRLYKPLFIRENHESMFKHVFGLWLYELSRYLNPIAILFPLFLGASLWVSLLGNLSSWQSIGALLAGITIACLVAGFMLTLLVLLQIGMERISLTMGWKKAQTIKTAVLRRAPNIAAVNALKGAFADGYTRSESPFTHTRAVFLFLISSLVYGAGYFVFNPAHPNFINHHTPPLVFFVLLITLLAVVLPSLSFFFDRYRVPVVLIILLTSVMSFRLSDTDHYYPLRAISPASAETGPRILTPADVVAAWNKGHPAESYPIMVVVATSGGGSKAATWTAHVLGALREDPALGERFAESITLVSSVSGGSVGALYSLDQYKAPDMPLSKAVGQASQSGLNAIAWGMVYPDLLRLIIPFNWLVDNTNDRGMSIERALQAQLAHETEVQPDTLLQWSQTIEKQWRPIQVFNTTIAESGQRLLLSSITIVSPFHTSPFAQAVNFVTLYSKCDLALATAARLSATFPYVTPMARPLSSETCVQTGEPRYHLADGGYFDNFGIMTVLEYLSNLNPQVYRNQFKRHKIILIQIRAAPIEGASAGGASTDGLAYANVGPLLASLQVQQVTQIGRNDLELELLRQQWAGEGIEIESVVFELHKNVVLSWHLTPGDIQDIADDFQQTGNQQSLERLKQIWQNN